MLRLISLLAALSLSAAAFPQTPASPAVRQVQLLAPQLLAFAGSAANFQSLVNGLTQGTPVTLTATGADGSVQIVTFAPGTALSAADAARVLESARQSLISRGIAAPSAQQLAIALTAGTTNLTAANLQALQAGLAQNTPVTLAGASGGVTFGAPGRALTPFEINQALQLASVMLAQQGILDPTPEQLRAALLGGTLATAAGSVPVQGILQGQVRNTSDSSIAGNTSNGPLVGTSDSRVVGTSNASPSVNAAPRALLVPGATAAPATAPASAPAAGAGTVRSPGITRR